MQARRKPLHARVWALIPPSYRYRILMDMVEIVVILGFVLWIMRLYGVVR